MNRADRKLFNREMKAYMNMDKKWFEKYQALVAELEAVKRERDFLLKYMTDSHWAACDICKHEPEEGNIHACKRIRTVKGAPCFEWKGLPEE